MKSFQHFIIFIIFFGLTNIAYSATVYKSISVSEAAKTRVVQQSKVFKITQRDTASRMLLEWETPRICAEDQYRLSREQERIKYFQLIHLYARLNLEWKTVELAEKVQKELLGQTVYEPSAKDILELTDENLITPEEIEAFINN